MVPDSVVGPQFSRVYSPILLHAVIQAVPASFMNHPAASLQAHVVSASTGMKLLAVSHWQKFSEPAVVMAIHPNMVPDSVVGPQFSRVYSPILLHAVIQAVPASFMNHPAASLQAQE
jgi:uncharacterized protein (DUF952 family)